MPGLPDINRGERGVALKVANIGTDLGAEQERPRDQCILPGGGWAGADFNGDASIDLADFNIWLTTLPPTAPLMDAVPVPEPTTMALFGLVGLLAAGRRRVNAPIRRSV